MNARAHVALGRPVQPKKSARATRRNTPARARARVCAMVLHFQYGSSAAAVRAGIEVEAKESKGNILFAFSHLLTRFPDWHHPFLGEKVLKFIAPNFRDCIKSAFANI